MLIQYAFSELFNEIYIFYIYFLCTFYWKSIYNDVRIIYYIGGINVILLLVKKIK